MTAAAQHRIPNTGGFFLPITCNKTRMVKLQLLGLSADCDSNVSSCRANADMALEMTAALKEICLCFTSRSRIPLSVGEIPTGCLLRKVNGPCLCESGRKRC